jgi:hypothetical protein
MSHALFMQMLLQEPLPEAFKRGCVSHVLSPESRQELDDDFNEEMRQEAREREQMEDDDE